MAVTNGRRLGSTIARHSLLQTRARRSGLLERCARESRRAQAACRWCLGSFHRLPREKAVRTFWLLAMRYSTPSKPQWHAAGGGGTRTPGCPLADDPIDGRPLLLQLQRWRNRQLSAWWSLCWSPSSCLHLDLGLISMLWCAALRCAALPFITDTVVMRRFIHQSRAPSCMLGPRRHAGPLRPPPPARASVPGAMTTCTRTVR